MNTAVDAPPLTLLNEQSTEKKLPCNMVFSYTQLEFGTYVSLYGLTAGPAAAINTPQLITPAYNPTAFFNGWSFGGEYGAYAMCYQRQEEKRDVLLLKGWITDLSTHNGEFQYIDCKFSLR